MSESSVSKLLRDVLFVSAVLMKGRYVASLKPSSPTEFETFVRNRLSKGIYLVSSTAGSRTFRALVADGTILGAVMEEGGAVVEGREALQKCLDGSVGVNVFEITDEVLNFVPNLRDQLKSLTSAPSAEPKPAPTTTPVIERRAPPSPPPPPPPSIPREVRVERSEAVALPRAADLKSILAMIESELPHTLRVIGIDVGRAVARMTEGKIVSVYLKIVNIPPPEFDAQKIGWITLSKVVTALGRHVNDFDYYLEIETPHQGAAVYQLLSPLDKVPAFVHGVVLYQLYTHGILVTSTKTKYDPSSNYVEAVYGVRPRSRDVALSTHILERLARECLRTVKIGFHGRVRIRLRAGFLTEGRAEG